MSRFEVRSILVASDLSGGSDQVVLAAAALAEQLGADLHVLHAVEAFGVPLPEAPMGLGYLQRVMGDARRKLDGQLQRVVLSRVRVASTRLDHRSAATAILLRAREVQADLIVVGPHRSWLPGSHLLGTTAQRVLEDASAPCLVVREPLATPLRRILVPVGEADVHRGLLATAGEWLSALLGPRREPDRAVERTEMRVLHVARTLPEWRAFSGELRQELRWLLGQPHVAENLRLRRSIAWAISPAREILRVADDIPVDLIAMGVRGHGALMRAILGSVSSTVLQRSGRSVLLIPPRLCEPLAPGGREQSHQERIRTIRLRSLEAEPHPAEEEVVPVPAGRA